MMNIDIIIQVVRLIKEKDREGLIIYADKNTILYGNIEEDIYGLYDEEFLSSSPIKLRDSYKRTIGAWICYRLDKRYPSNIKEFNDYLMLSTITSMMDIGFYEVKDLCLSRNLDHAMDLIFSILSTRVPVSYLLTYL